MCVCRPEIRTPYCGRPGCRRPREPLDPKAVYVVCHVCYGHPPADPAAECQSCCGRGVHKWNARTRAEVERLYAVKAALLALIPSDERPPPCLFPPSPPPPP